MPAQAWTGSLVGLRDGFWEGSEIPGKGAGGSQEKARAHFRGHMSPKCTHFGFFVGFMWALSKRGHLGSDENIITWI